MDDWDPEHYGHEREAAVSAGGALAPDAGAADALATADVHERAT